MGILHGHTDAVESVSFSPSGATLASAGADMTLRLWRVTPQRHYALGPPLRPGGPVYNVGVRPEWSDARIGQLQRGHSVERSATYGARNDSVPPRRRVKRRVRAGNWESSGRGWVRWNRPPVEHCYAWRSLASRPWWWACQERCLQPRRQETGREHGYRDRCLGRRQRPCCRSPRIQWLCLQRCVQPRWSDDCRGRERRGARSGCTAVPITARSDHLWPSRTGVR